MKSIISLMLHFKYEQIWDLSDPTGKGFLDKSGLFVALKLVALAQSGDTINMSNILNDAPNPPKVVSYSVAMENEKKKLLKRKNGN